MAKDNKKATITDEHRAEAARLKPLWQSRKSLGQAEFGKLYGIGGQGAVSNYLNGLSALNLKAARAFSDHLGCQISEFSPRLAKEADQIVATVAPHLPSQSHDLTSEELEILSMWRQLGSAHKSKVIDGLRALTEKIKRDADMTHDLFTNETEDLADTGYVSRSKQA